MPDKATELLKPKTIGLVNWVGLMTLVQREVGRFFKVYSQTIVAPVVTTLLFYAVFALAFGGDKRMIGDIHFLDFLAPGLIMMAMAQNSFANTSSSLIIAKIQGNIVDVLMPPLSSAEIFFGFLIGGVLRGLCVGFVGIIALAVFVDVYVSSIITVLAFAVVGNLLMASLGIIAGMWADRFDHIAAFTNFVITPLTFLSGTFYAIDSLPPIWQKMALVNPFFYMIDGFRSGFIGHADSAVLLGFFFLAVICICVMGLTYTLIRMGYKIKT